MNKESKAVKLLKKQIKQLLAVANTKKIGITIIVSQGNSVFGVSGNQPNLAPIIMSEAFSFLLTEKYVEDKKFTTK